MAIKFSLPFAHKDIKSVIEFINPKYLVYEVRTDSSAMPENSVKVQNDIL